MVTRRHPTAVINRCNLRYADTGDDTGRANRTRSDTDFNRIRAGFDQCFGRLAGRYVARDQIGVRECFAQVFDRANNARGVTVRRIDNEHIHIGAYQCFRAFQHVTANADGRRRQQTTVAVFRGVRIFFCFFDIFNRDQTAQIARAIYQRQFFDAVLPQQTFRIFQ